jgi:hypothetical protein
MNFIDEIWDKYHYAIVNCKAEEAKQYFLQAAAELCHKQRESDAELYENLSYEYEGKCSLTLKSNILNNKLEAE